MTAPANLRGWGQGWPVNRSSDMATVRAARSGTSFTVHKLIAPIIKYLIDETERRGYLLDHGSGDQDDDWSYANRPIRGKLVASNHSWGLAVDIDATQFGLGSKKRLPQWIVDLWRAHGFDYGGDWSGRKDPMHFEFNGWPSDARRIAAQVAGRPAPGTTPPPYNPPTPPTPRSDEDDEMPKLRLHHDGAWWLYRGAWRSHVADAKDLATLNKVLSATGDVEDLRGKPDLSNLHYRHSRDIASLK